MSAETTSRNNRWAALACALAAVVVFQFFGNANRGYIDTGSLFWWWGSQWFEPAAEMEHGVLVLVIAGWLFRRNLRGAESVGGTAESLELRAESQSFPDRALSSQLSALNSPWPAFAAMAGGLALHALGFVAQQARLSILALLLFTWGALRLAGGRRWSAAAAFPLGFLSFAIPFSGLDTTGFWLRMWVTRASAAIAHAAGIGVLRSGTQLISPDGQYHYDVVAACSGMRSLIAMLALSLLLGYLSFRSWWRRALTLALCFPLVVVGNIARITAIIFAAQWGGQVWGDRTHTVMGWGVFAIVLGGVLLAVRALERWWPEPRPAAEKGAAPANPVCNVIRYKPVWVVASAVVALAVGELFFLRAVAQAPVRGLVGIAVAADGRNPVELPAFLGTEWAGRRAEVTAVEREILPADTGFSRKNYIALGDPTKQVLVSLVLSGRDRTSIHRPELCLVGQGFTITAAAEHRFTFPGRTDAARDFPATLLRVRRELPAPAGAGRAPRVETHLVAYWFVSGDAVVATHGARLARDAWNRVAHGRVDRWAYVLLQTPAGDGEAAALARMQAVLSETLPVFQQPLAGR